VRSMSDMSVYWGNISPFVKEHFPQESGNNFPMPRKRPHTAQTVAANIQALIEFNKTTAPKVAEQAGIDRKTVNNMLKGRFEPNLTNVEAVAGVFGLSAWQLLRPNLKNDLVKSSVMDRLISDFYDASEEDRGKILGVAEMAAKYKRK
jgi:transcriptional regulator with XRE-family HTH domain